MAVEDLLRPSSIALVGASPRGEFASIVFRNLRAIGFPGRVFLVNPNYKELWGEKCYPSIKDVPGKLDQALLLVRSELSAFALNEAGERGVRSAIIYSSGYSEAGGHARERELKEIAGRFNIRFCGPNCLGTISVREKSITFAQNIVPFLSVGEVGLIFQSGGSLGAWIRSASDRGIGMSYAISSGNETDLDMVDYLNFLVQNEDTKVIVLLVEGVRRPKDFMEVCDLALSLGKPIIAVKIGRSQQAKLSALTHTGVLAGDDQTFNALCRKAGIVRFRTLDDLLEGAEALKQGRLPQNNKLAVVLTSGGLRGLVLDLADELGLTLPMPSPGTRKKLQQLLPPEVPPQNPLDMGIVGFSNQELYLRCAEIFLEDPEIDLLLVHGELPRTESLAGHNPSLYARLPEKTSKPIFFFSRCSHSITDYGRQFRKTAGVAFLQDAFKSLVAIRACIEYAKIRRERVEGRGDISSSITLSDSFVKPIRELREPLNIVSGEILLRGLGIPVVQGAVARSAEDAASISSSFGFPVVLKVHSAKIMHKSDIGGVILGITDTKQVLAGYTKIQRAVGEQMDGVLVQKMVSNGLEAILGYKDDSLYGPVLMFGLGGIYAEVIRAVSFRLPPVTEREAQSLVQEVQGKQLFEEWRGRPRRDVSSLVRCIVCFSEAIVQLTPYLSSLEINPLMVLEEGSGVVAVDLIGIRANSVPAN